VFYLTAPTFFFNNHNLPYQTRLRFAASNFNVKKMNVCRNRDGEDDDQMSHYC